MLEVFSQGAIATPMYSLKGPKMLAKDHTPNFPLQHAHKDMKLAVDMAKEAGVKYAGEYIVYLIFAYHYLQSTHIMNIILTSHAVTESAEELFQKARSDEDLKVAEEDFSAG